MTRNGRSSRWAAALALGLAGLISGSAATVHAAPAARTAANPFELTFEATPTTPPEYWAVEGTFRSRAPFCASGRFFLSYEAGVRFTCDDGTGSLTVGFGRKRWTIGDGAGSYAGFRGKGSLQVETPIPWRGTLRGVVDRDAVAPTIAYDAAVVGEDASVPGGRAASLAIPVLIMDGSETYPFMHVSAVALANALPNARHRTLEGQTHEVAAEALAPVLVEFFTASE